MLTSAQQPASFAAYEQIEAVNWSTLKHLRRSPLHYRHALTTESADTDALRLGRAVHTAVLEPDRFALEYAVWQGGRRAGAEWTAFQVAHEEQTILTLDQYQRACSIRDSVRSHPVAAPYLREGKAEQTIEWAHEKTKIRLKGRPDWISPTALVDLKTSRHAINYRLFATDVYRLGYHCQLAMYQAGIKATMGMELPPVLIAVEPEPPHDVAVYLLDEDAIYAGAEEVDELLQALRECQQTGSWRGRYSSAQDLSLPRWAFPDEEDGEAIEDPEWMR